MIFSVIFILGAGLMLGANGERGLGLILGGRVLAGVGVGACSMVVPIYISEISPPAVRGRLVGIYGKHHPKTIRARICADHANRAWLASWRSRWFRKSIAQYFQCWRVLTHSPVDQLRHSGDPAL